MKEGNNPISCLILKRCHREKFISFVVVWIDSMMLKIPLVDSFYFFLFNRFIFSLLLPLQPLSKLIASSMDCSEKPLCMIK